MLAFFEQLWAIGRTTYSESVRQPVLLAAVVAGTILVVLSIPLSGFTLDDDQKLFVDLGLSTIFVTQVILAAFLATNVLNRELENRTALTVLSKPVARATFVLGKFLGVAGALLTSMAFLSLVFLLVEMQGAFQTVRTPYHEPVITFGISALLLTAIAAATSNFLYGWSFSSMFVLIGVPLLLLAYVLSLLFDVDWARHAIGTNFDSDLLIALAGLSLGLLMLVSVAIAVSTRLGQLPTLVATIAVFLLGMVSDWIFGRPIAAYEARFAEIPVGEISVLDASHLAYYACRVAYAVVPNYQIFWLADAITQGRAIPLDYLLGLAVPYGVLVIVASLALATVLFQRREIS